MDTEFGKRLKNWTFGFVLGWNNITIIILSPEVIFSPLFKFPKHRKLKMMVSALHNPLWNCRAKCTNEAVITLTPWIIWMASSEQSSTLVGNTSDLCIKNQPGAEMNPFLGCQSHFFGPWAFATLPWGGSWMPPGPWNMVLALQPGLCSRKDFPECNFPFKINNCCNRAALKSAV